MTNPSPKPKPVERGLDPDLRTILDQQIAPSLWPMFLGAAIVAGVWLVLGFLPWMAQEGWPWKLSWRLSKASEFGDSFGFVNSLFSGLALAGVVVAILLQRQELVEQRKELIITQWELKKTADAQRDSQRELAKQADTNLNSAILSSLQGMHDFAMFQMESKEPLEKEDGLAAARLAQIMRQTVLLNILSGDTSNRTRQQIRDKLNRWSMLTFIRGLCTTLKNMAVGVVYSYPTDDDGNRYEEVLEDGNKANAQSVAALFDQLSVDIDRLEMALSESADPSASLFRQWLQTAKEKNVARDFADLPERMLAFVSFCDASIENATRLRSSLS